MDKDLLIVFGSLAIFLVALAGISAVAALFA